MNRPGPRRTVGADALTDVRRFFLDHQQTQTGGGHRPDVNLAARTAGDPAAGRTVDGVTLSPETISRLLCDSGIHRIVDRGPSTILDYRHTSRTIAAPVFNALVLRDQHCRWAGCDRPPHW